MKRLFKRLTWLFVVVLLAAFALAFQGYRSLVTPLEFPDQVLQIAPGSGFSTVTAELQQRNIITQPLFWKIYARITGKAKQVQAGEYELTGGVSARQLLEKMVRGDVVRYQVTLIEGRTFKQLLAALAENDELHHELSGLTPKQVMAKLGKPEEHPEGRFFPDSYHFTRGTSDLDILKRAYQRLETVLEEEWQQREKELPYKSAYEALIMASIVEKETGLAEERPEIAGVFVRRLNKGMRLQTDPTVIYGLGDQYQGNIKRKHLLLATPYNTYVIRGLPPTPIAAAGREAIHAALHPKPGKSLYFVARGDGSHFFSDTLEQHNEAVRRYQINQRAEQYRSSPKTN